MTNIIICLLIAVLLPNLIAFSAVRYRFSQFGGPDIRNPRTQGEKLTGAGERTTAAQKNAWEALAVFVATLVAGFAAEIPLETMALGSTIFIIARLIHPVAYIGNIAPLRILSWLTGLGACIWIIVKAI